MTALWAALLALVQSGDGDWPRFRGPSGDGVAPAESDPPVEWSESRNVAWKTALPGRGRSSPILQGDRLFVTFARERNVRRTRIGPDDMQVADHVALGIAAVDARSGGILWETPLREVERPDPVHWLNSWATPTPVVGAGRLFCDFGGWGTWCLDPATGKVLWEKRIPLDHQVGPGSSLAFEEGLLVLVRDGREAQFVLALDGTTGETVWKTDRPPIRTNHPNTRKSFSTPIRIEADGRRQLVAVGPHWIASYDPRTGRELWRLRHGEGFSIGSVPVLGHGLVYFSTGCMRPSLLAVRADGEGELPPSAVAWRADKGVPVMSSPILAGDLLYWTSDEGILTAANARTGEVRFQARLGEGHLASPILAAGRLYFFGREGKTTVLRPGADFEKLAENRIGGTVIASPAVSGKALFLRTDTHLYRLENRAP